MGGVVFEEENEAAGVVDAVTLTVVGVVAVVGEEWATMLAAGPSLRWGGLAGSAGVAGGVSIECGPMDQRRQKKELMQQME